MIKVVINKIKEQEIYKIYGFDIGIGEQCIFDCLGLGINHREHFQSIDVSVISKRG